MVMDVPKAEDRSPRFASTDGMPADRLELRGLKCPLPAIRTQKTLSRLPPGAILEVFADDPLAPLDIAHLCRAGGHALLESAAIEANGFRFTICRGDKRD